MNFPVRLGVSPAVASTPAGVFDQRFETLFPLAGTLGCVVCLAPWLFLLVYLHRNVRPPSPQSATSQGPLATHCLARHLCCRKCSLPQLSISAPPTGLDECFFFNSLVVGLPYGSIFCWFWVFFFLICCCPFGCARRHSVSTYASILAGSHEFIYFNQLLLALD